MGKILFTVSDIHGHYTALMKALEAAGFDQNNEDHIFVSCGDLFDRGRENAEVYDFVKSLPRKILIRGNHEDGLFRILKQGYLEEDEFVNETDITVLQLLGKEALDSAGKIDVIAYAEKKDEILSFIGSMRDYYETDRYIFTHGWLPIAFAGRRPAVDPLWREASEEEWQLSHTQEWQQLYSVGAVLEGKTIVCGHRPAYMGYQFDYRREHDCNEPFYGVGMIAIDPNVIRSGVVHVLILEI